MKPRKIGPDITQWELRDGVDLALGVPSLTARLATTHLLPRLLAGTTPGFMGCLSAPVLSSVSRSCRRGIRVMGQWFLAKVVFRS